jgi:PAS domain S-box-containing protein
MAGVRNPFHLSLFLLGKRRFHDYADGVRARILISAIVFSFPMPIVNAFHMRDGIGRFPVFAFAALLISLVLLCGLRKRFNIRVSGIIFCLAMELMFVESSVHIGSPSMIIGLVFIPFLAVLLVGSYPAALLLPIPILFAFDIHRLIPFFMTEGLPPFAYERFSPDTVNVIVFVGLLYVAACALERLFLGIFASYRSEKQTARQQIEERKNKEKELADSLRILEAILSAVPVPLFVKDKNLRYSRFSDSLLEYWGIEENVLLGKQTADVFPPETARLLDEADPRQAESDTFQRCSVKFPWSGDGVRDVSIYKTPLKSEEGKLIGLVGVYIDETERIQRERKLESLLDSHRDALALLGHDLRNPLGSFRELVRSMETDMTINPKECHEILSQLSMNLDSLYHLLDDLLDLVKTEEGMMSFNPKILELFFVTEKVIFLSLPQAEQKRITVENTVPSDAEIFADERMLKTLLRNLIGNALKFTPRGGKVSVSSRTSEEGLMLMVNDTGIGMLPSAVRAIFDSGRIRQRRGTDGEPGTGLGLPLCRRLIERHGGHMNIESTEAGGSTFSLFFPGIFVLTLL